MSDNATFHSFKPSGKWYATGRGVLTKDVFEKFDRSERRRCIVATNGDKYPGLSGPGSEFIFVVIADETVDFGYPLMLFPT